MLNVSEVFDDREIEDCYESYIVTKPTPSYILNSIFSCIVNLTFAVLGSFLNALVICVFWKTSKLRYKVSYFVIMVLSSIDFSVTLVVHLSHLVMSIAEMVERSNCLYKLFHQVSAVILSGMSLMTFFVMNVERYLSIVHPLFHLKYVTNMRCLAVCTGLWFVSGPQWNCSSVEH